MTEDMGKPLSPSVMEALGQLLLRPPYMPYPKPSGEEEDVPDVR